MTELGLCIEGGRLYARAPPGTQRRGTVRRYRPRTTRTIACSARVCQPVSMTNSDEKGDLVHYLTAARGAVAWKLEGLTEYELRRPVVPTGTNLLGLVKHLASIEVWYFGLVFDRPFPEDLPWLADDAPDNADMWALQSESSRYIRDLYQRATDHSDATIAQLDLDSPGVVPWWGDEGNVTLRLILVHVIAETNRHAGHADIARELIDGNVGLRRDVSNLPDQSRTWWSDYRTQLEEVAQSFNEQPPQP